MTTYPNNEQRGDQHIDRQPDSYDDDTKPSPGAQTIDMTPTWRELLPMLVHLQRDGTTLESRETAGAELFRMANIADQYVEITKRHAKAEGFIALPFETVERVTDALNALLLKSTNYRHRAAADPQTLEAELVHAEEAGRTALRELATMTSAGMSTVDNLEAQREGLMQSVARLVNVLNHIAGLCADQYPDAQRQIGAIAGAADEALHPKGGAA